MLLLDGVCYIRRYISYVTHLTEVTHMKMTRVVIQLPQPLKLKLDAERKRSTTAAGLIRHLLEQHFKDKKAA